MFRYGIIRIVLNSVGASLRWLYGTTWRTIYNKPKFTFKEYLYGPKKSDYFDDTAHQFNNRFIAIIFIGVLIFFFMR